MTSENASVVITSARCFAGAWHTGAMNDPLPSGERRPQPPGFHAQLVLAVLFALLALGIWWTSRTATEPGPALAQEVQRGLLLPFVLGAVSAAINAQAIRGGRALSPALRGAPILVFLAALLVLRLAG